MSGATRGVGGRARTSAAGAAAPAAPPAVARAHSLGTGDPARYASLRLPLTAALIRAGLGGLSMSTPGHRGGRFFGAWDAQGDAKRR